MILTDKKFVLKDGIKIYEEDKNYLNKIYNLNVYPLKSLVAGNYYSFYNTEDGAHIYMQIANNKLIVYSNETGATNTLLEFILYRMQYNIYQVQDFIYPFKIEIKKKTGYKAYYTDFTETLFSTEGFDINEIIKDLEEERKYQINHYYGEHKLLDVPEPFSAKIEEPWFERNVDEKEFILHKDNKIIVNKDLEVLCENLY